MSEFKRFSTTAVVLLVVLRLAIGWQLLYEGLWKIDTLSSVQPWTSAGYLRASEGPLRPVFRKMVGDPDELGWLDYDTVAARWEDWASRFHRHYSLDERQTGALNRLLYGGAQKVGDRPVYAENLAKLPSGIDDLNAASRVSNKYLWFDAQAGKLYVDGQNFLEPGEKARVLALVEDRSDEEAVQFRDSLARLYERQKRGMGVLQKLTGLLKGNPDLLGNEDWQRLGKLEEYRKRLAVYEQKRRQAKTQFQWDHLNHEWGKLQTLRAELTSPVKALEAEFREQAQKLLETSQFAQGAMPEPWTALRITDVMTIAGLTILGSLLIAGFMTRFAAVMAAFMLFNFYMAMPPWPGLPEAPGTEHSYIVNKNLIEVFALLALAALPTGAWFGLDGLLGRLLRRRGQSDSAAAI